MKFLPRFDSQEKNWFHNLFSFEIQLVFFLNKILHLANALHSFFPTVASSATIGFEVAPNKEHI